MKTIIRLLRFLRPFAGEIFLSILLGIATIGAGIGMLGTSAYLITFAALHPSIADLQVAIVGVRFFGISRSAFRYLERLVSHSVNLKVLANIRSWFYRNIEPLAPAGLQDYHSGDLLDRVMADIETLQDFYVRVVSPLAVAAVVTLGMSLIVGSYAARLGWIIFTGMFLNGFILPILFLLITRKSSEELLANRSIMSRLMLEYFQGLEDLQAAEAQPQWSTKIQKCSNRYSAIQTTNGMISGANEALVLLVSSGTVLAILLAAVPLVRLGSVTGISLAVVVLLTMASFEATNPIPAAAQNMMASLAAGRRIFEVAGGETTDQVKPETIPDEVEINRIKASGLRFHYPDSAEMVLDGVNMAIEKGQRVALAGPSGAGKTTLTELLLGYWCPQDGELQYISENQNFLNPLQHGNIFGVISQNAYLFSESLRNNLLLAKPSASDGELIEAIGSVELLDWFGRLPDGLDTWLGERGQQMSGGEHQRLALARVLLQDSPFVILDEPTSHLDPETARSIMHMIFHRLTGKGILLVTHQLELLDEFDMIYFIKGGKVCESGTKAELLLRRGDFFSFHQIQSEGILL
jgi:ATP-binding cassette subfamily C protein CydC